MTVDDPVPCVAPGPDFTEDAPIQTGELVFDTCQFGDSYPNFGNEHDVCVEVIIPCPGTWLFDTCKSPVLWDSIMNLSLEACGGTPLFPDSNLDNCDAQVPGHESRILTTTAGQTYPLSVFVTISGAEPGLCGEIVLNVCDQDAPELPMDIDKVGFEWPADFNLNPVGPNAPQDPLIDPANPAPGYEEAAGPPFDPASVDCDPNPDVQYQDTLIGPNTVPNCDKLWIVERVWTVTDWCGNASSVTQEINFFDTLPPVIQLEAPKLSTEDIDGVLTCEAELPDLWADGDASATDACTPADQITVTQDPPAGTFVSNGDEVTITATDLCGNVETVTFQIEVNDIFAPTFTTPEGSLDKKIQCDESTGPAHTGIPLVVDNCTPTNQIRLVSRDITEVGNCPQQVIITRIWTATDAAGNTAQFEQIITISDDFPPVFVGPNGNPLPPGALNTTMDCAGVVPPVVLPAVEDNCDANPTVIATDVENVNDNGVGTILRTFTATDACGNSSQYLQIITVVDTTPPTIACPGNLVVANDLGECGAIVSFADMVTADDDCDADPSVSCVPMSGSFFPVGTTTVTCTATDRGGLSATCSFDVTVNDDEDPVIMSCPATQKVDNDPGVCGAAVSFAMPSVSDNCPGATIARTDNTGLNSGDTFPVGITTIEFTATDAAGNTAICSFDIEVNDSEQPVLTCPMGIKVDNDPDACDAVVEFEVTLSDNCPGATFACSAESGDTFPVGTTTVTCDAQDAAGNTATCSFDIEVNDAQDPILTCPAGIKVDNDTNDCGAEVDFTVTVEDNCPGATFTCSTDSGDFFEVGVTTVTCDAQDAAGNTATCSFDIEVNDTEAPTIACPGSGPANSLTKLDVDAMCEAQVPDLLQFIEITDNCPGVIFEQDPAAGTTNDLGMAGPEPGFFDVLITATDAAGNTSTCLATYQVNDITDPVIVRCPGDLTGANALRANAELGCVAILPDLRDQLVATDNCEDFGLDVFQTPAPGTQLAVGSHLITMTVRDESGNDDTCSVEVEVLPLQPLSLSVTLEGGFNNSFDRCLTLELWQCPDDMTPSYSQDITVTFTNGVVQRRHRRCLRCVHLRHHPRSAAQPAAPRPGDPVRPPARAQRHPGARQPQR